MMRIVYLMLTYLSLFIAEQNSRLVPIKCFIEKDMVRVITQIQSTSYQLIYIY